MRSWTSNVDEQQITEIIRQAARIVEQARVTERLQPCAFRVAAEALLYGAPGRPIHAEAAQGPPTEVAGRAINEFLATLRPRAHTERFLAMAYYLLQEQGQLTFSVRDVHKLYTLARERRPKNAAAIANQCAKRGLLADTGRKLDGLKEWQITKTGEALVEQLLSKSKQR